MSMLLIDDMSSSQGSDADGGAEPVAPSSPAPSAPRLGVEASAAAAPLQHPLKEEPPASPKEEDDEDMTGSHAVCPTEAAALQDALDQEKKKQPALNRSTASGGRGVRAKAQPAPPLTADQAAAKATAMQKSASEASACYRIRVKARVDEVGAEVGETQATPKGK